MSKKSIKNAKFVKKSDREYKRGIKRIWICVLCLIPVMIMLGVLLGELKLPEWLIIMINVIVGGFGCLIIYIIFDKIEAKKKIKELMDIDEKDPFKD
ncbi:MAG: hypothetical protein J6Q51_02540 [Clostridia bacterium]|nr:hypothetical protein [Clostridia bacterium]